MTALRVDTIAVTQANGMMEQVRSAFAKKTLALSLKTIFSLLDMLWKAFHELPG